MAEEPIVETTEDARSGVTRKGVRYVLAVGLILVIVAFVVVAFVIRPTG